MKTIGRFAGGTGLFLISEGDGGISLMSASAAGDEHGCWASRDRERRSQLDFLKENLDGLEIVVADPHGDSGRSERILSAWLAGCEPAQDSAWLLVNWGKVAFIPTGTCSDTNITVCGERLGEGQSDHYVLSSGASLEAGTEVMLTDDTGDKVIALAIPEKRVIIMLCDILHRDNHASRAVLAFIASWIRKGNKPLAPSEVLHMIVDGIQRRLLIVKPKIDLAQRAIEQLSEETANQIRVLDRHQHDADDVARLAEEARHMRVTLPDDLQVTASGDGLLCLRDKLRISVNVVNCRFSVSFGRPSRLVTSSNSLVLPHQEVVLGLLEKGDITSLIQLILDLDAEDLKKSKAEECKKTRTA